MSEDRQQRVEDWLIDREVELHLEKVSQATARRQCAAELGVGSLDPGEWLDALSVCRYYGRRVKRSTSKMLGSEGWDALQSAVSKCLEDMQGRRLDECVRLVGTIKGCNPRLLLGLPKRFHVWTQESVDAMLSGGA